MPTFQDTWARSAGLETLEWVSEAQRCESPGSRSPLGVNSFAAAPHGGRGLTTDGQW